jgi:hypothetical protein
LSEQIAAKAKAGRDVEEREAHHTKAQIAAKARAGRDLTQDEIEEDEDDALLTSLAPGGEIEKRHHTKAQIAAKAKAGRDLEIEEREAHHTKGTFSSPI